MLTRPQKRAVAFPGSAGKPYPALADVVRALEGLQPIDHLVFGDSVMERVSNSDEDKRTLGEMIADKIAPESVTVISRAAHHATIYEALLRAASTQPGKPRRSIVLPINMRWFSPQWDANPAWQFEQELRLLARYLMRRDRSISPVEDVVEDPRALSRYETTAVVYPLSRYTTVGDFLRVRAAKPEGEDAILARRRDIFIFHYGHPLSAEHRKLKALTSAAAIAADLAPRVLVYVTPLDVDAMERIVGRELVSQVRANVEIVSRALQGRIVDWSETIPQGDFFAPTLPTEHLNASGRTKIATLIFEHLASQPTPA